MYGLDGGVFAGQGYGEEIGGNEFSKDRDEVAMRYMVEVTRRRTRALNAARVQAAG